MEDPVVPLERNLYGHPLAGLLWERQFEKVLQEHCWEIFPNWARLRKPRKRSTLVCVCGRYQAGWKKNKYMSPTWRILMIDVALGKPKSSSTTFYWVAFNETAKRTEIVKNYRYVWIQDLSLQEIIKNFQFPRNRTHIFPHGLMTWKVMQRNVWKDVANWQTRQRNNHTESQHHALKCLFFGTYWLALYFMFCEQTTFLAQFSSKMDQSLWQTIISFDLLHSSWKQSILLWETQHNNAD